MRVPAARVHGTVEIGVRGQVFCTAGQAPKRVSAVLPDARRSVTCPATIPW